MYSPKLNLVFIHIPKCAGTSVIEAIRKLDSQAAHGHFKASAYIDEMNSRTMAFTVVRDPYERAFSAYCYARMERSFWHEAGTQTEHLEYKMCRSNSFSDVMQFLYEQKHLLSLPELERPFFRENWNPQHLYLDADIPVRIFRYETQMSDVSHLLQSKGIDLLWLNRTDKHSSLREHCDPRTAALIFDIYQEDFRRFGYPR